MSKINAELALALALDGKVTRFDDETAQLVAVVGALRALPEPDIDPVFATALEQRLLTEGLEETPMPVGRPHLVIVSDVEEAPIVDTRPADNIVSMPTRRFRMRKVAVAVAASFALGAFPAMAAVHSLPGSPFYGLKQNIRSAKLFFFGDQLQDARWRLGFASDHVREAEALVALGANQSLVAHALDLASYELAKATDAIEGIDDADGLSFFAGEVEAAQRLLAKSAPTLVPEASDAFERAMQAAHELTVRIASALGMDDNTLAPIVAALANEMTTVIEGASQGDPEVTVEANGSAKVSTEGESASDGTKSTGSKTGSTGGNSGGAPGTGTGKAIRDAGPQACTFAGAHQLNQATEGSFQDTCSATGTVLSSLL